MKETFDRLKIQFSNDAFPSLKTRKARLQSIRNLILEYTPQLCEAISSDFGNRCHHETKLTEIFSLLNQIKYLEDHLPLWIQEEERPIELMFQSASAKVAHVPLGVVGIMTPWNFPLLLSLSPLMTALAAGNVAMVKMSEFSPKTAALLKEAVEKHLDGCAKVFAGDLDSNKEFAELPFDHLFFTGSPRVGSLVMQAAARNLTPVTLELGGKCPVFAAPDVNLKKLAERLAWGKSINAGQICIAPDYLICPEERVDNLVDGLKSHFQEMYPNGAFDQNYTSIISEKHFQRLLEYLNEAKAAGATILPLHASALDQDNRKMVPHLILNPPLNSQVMKEEIFGPLLPILTYSDFKETKKYLELNPNPLAIYLFTEDKKVIEDFQYFTASGGLCINDLLIHFSQEHLPFGGVRTSGIGQYHGVEGFLTFTRPKTIFKRGSFSVAKAGQPPYQSPVLKWLYRWMGLRNTI